MEKSPGLNSDKSPIVFVSPEEKHTELQLKRKELVTGLSICQCVFGVAAIVISAVQIYITISEDAYGDGMGIYGALYMLGYGIWCGFFYVVAGCVSLCAKMKVTKAWLKASTAMCIVATVFAGFHLALVILDIVMTYWGNHGFLIPLLIIGVAEFIVSVIASTQFGCKCCCTC